MTALAPLSSQPTHEADLDISALVLDTVGRQVRALRPRIDASILDGSLERTMDGASTLTLVVHDPDRVLLRSGVFSEAIQVRLDNLLWRLVKVAKQDNDLTLTFEDREVALLRAATGPKKASNRKGKKVRPDAAPRARVTRAEFALSLVREVKVTPPLPFICPELHTTQKVEGIANQKQQRTAAERAKERQRGLNPATVLKVKGAAADRSQILLAERVLDVADSLTAGSKATLALVEACIVESLLRNPSGGDADSRGVLQVRDSTARPMGIDNRDPAACANAFLQRGFTGKGGAIALSRSHPSWSAGQIAQACQGSAYPSRYDQVEMEAQAFLSAYDGTGVGDPTTITKTIPYQFRRGSTDGVAENTWDCLQRLAQEVNWRCFMSAGSLYFISETELLKAKPRLILDEDSPGVLGIDFDCDGGKKADEVNITARANRWSAPPGSVVQLKNLGPADGRYLVADITRPLFDATATIQLRRPSKPLLEPAPDTQDVSVGGGFDSGGLTGSSAAKAYQAAQALGRKRYPYVWGGGHGAAGTPSGGPPIGFDCSGSTCAVLAAAGMGFRVGGPVDTSGTIAATWGVAGEGQAITVWANDIHVFMVFHTAEGDKHFGTGDWGKGWGGAGFNPRLHPTAGFTPRHWPGT